MNSTIEMIKMMREWEKYKEEKELREERRAERIKKASESSDSMDASSSEQKKEPSEEEKLICKAVQNVVMMDKFEKMPDKELLDGNVHVCSYPLSFSPKEKVEDLNSVLVVLQEKKKYEIVSVSVQDDEAYIFYK